MTALMVHPSDDGAGATFEFTDGPVEAFAVVVVDEETDTACWFCVSDAFSDILPYTTIKIDVDLEASSLPSDIESALLKRGVDPAALEEARRTNRLLGSFTYGVVPSGFLQAAPSGPSKPLNPARRYSVTVVGALGAVFAHASFTTRVAY
jgi:hypothetical protein